MKATLTKVGPYGVQTDQTGDKWISNGKGKYEVVKDILKSFTAGNEVELEYVQNGQYLNLKSLTKIGEGIPAVATVKSSYNGNRSYKTNPEDALRMSRAAAVAAVFSSPALATQLQNGDVSEAFSSLEGETVRVTNFILNGKFSEHIETNGGQN